MEIRVYDTLPEDARQIRQEVFIEEQHFQEEFDGIDSRALHLVLYRDGSPAGTCRFFSGKGAGSVSGGKDRGAEAFPGTEPGSRAPGGSGA